MNEHPFRRILLLCDTACDIRRAVMEAAVLAAQWGAALHGIYLDDENLHRFAALPFGQYVSLSAVAAEALSAEEMARVSSAISANMKRVLADAAKAHGLQWNFRTIRNVPSAVSVEAEQGDILVVERAARTFSGAWRPDAAWEKSPVSFSGTVLLNGRGRSRRGLLVFLPEDRTKRDAVLAAGAALAEAHQEIILVGPEGSLADAASVFADYLAAGPRAKQIDTRTRDADGHAPGSRPALVVVHADDASDWVGETEADILLVRT